MEPLSSSVACKISTEPIQLKLHSLRRPAALPLSLRRLCVSSRPPPEEPLSGASCGCVYPVEGFIRVYCVFKRFTQFFRSVVGLMKVLWAAFRRSSMDCRDAK